MGSAGGSLQVSEKRLTKQTDFRGVEVDIYAFHLELLNRNCDREDKAGNDDRVFVGEVVFREERGNARRESFHSWSVEDVTVWSLELNMMILKG